MRPLLVPVVKATFELSPRGTLTLAEEQAPLELKGQRWDPKDETSSERYEPEVAFFKPATDMVLVGHAYRTGPPDEGDGRRPEGGSVAEGRAGRRRQGLVQEHGQHRHDQAPPLRPHPPALRARLRGLGSQSPGRGEALVRSAQPGGHRASASAAAASRRESGCPTWRTPPSPSRPGEIVLRPRASASSRRTGSPARPWPAPMTRPGRRAASRCCRATSIAASSTPPRRGSSLPATCWATSPWSSRAPPPRAG